MRKNEEFINIYLIHKNSDLKIGLLCLMQIAENRILATI